MPFHVPTQDGWASSSGSHRQARSIDSDSMVEDRPPQHPMPAMQGAFEESIDETLAELDQSESEHRLTRVNSVLRRKMLLECQTYERTVGGRWKQKPGERFHPLVKLVAQISFGMHLLHQGLAKSDEEVISILQTHVDEIDGFLERTAEDFEFAQGDIDDRLLYLKISLQHGDVFDNMLDDRAFRIAIVEGNEKIEHIVDRTAAAMRDSLKDIQKGLDSTKELAKYLAKLDRTWPYRTKEHAAVFLAMVGNTEGWSAAYVQLQQKGSVLSQALVELEQIIADLQRWAGIASRRNIVSSDTPYNVNIPSYNPSPRYSLSPPQSPRKTLPREPKPSTEASQSSRPRTQETQNPPAEQRQSPHRSPSIFSKASKEPRRPDEDIPTQHNSSQATPSIAAAAPKPFKSILPPNRFNSSKGVTRKMSLAERTRSITRRLSFFSESEENDELGPLPNLDMRIDRFASRSIGSGQSKPQVAKLSDDHVVSPQSETVSPYDLDAVLRSGSTKTEFSPLSFPSASNSPISGSTEYHEALRAANQQYGQIDHSHLPLQDIRAKEIRFASTALGGPFKPILKDLPLRHFRSQESIPKEEGNGSSVGASALPKMSHTVRDTPNSTDGSTYSSETKPADIAIKMSSFSPPDLTHTTSAYKPGDATSSEYSKSQFDSLSPPSESSDAPLPAHATPLKPINAAPKTPPCEDSRASTPLEKLTSACVTGPEVDFYPYIPSPSPSTRSYADTLRSHADTTRSHADTPSEVNETALHARGAPVSRSKAAGYNLQLHHPSASTSALTNGRSAIGSSDHSDDHNPPAEREPKSPWKKVFGNVGFGGSSKSPGESAKGSGHRKSKSEKLDMSVFSPDAERDRTKRWRDLVRRESFGQTADSKRFAGLGKEGLWPPRKNILRT